MFLWIFGCFKSVPSMFFCFKLLLILNLTNAVLSKTTFGSIFDALDGLLCDKKFIGWAQWIKKSITSKETYDFDSTADKVSRLSPKLSL